jgi:cobalt-zinc-cadmium efflux system membrane fusion protein
MNEEPNEVSPPIETTVNTRRRRRRGPIIVAIVAVVAIVAIVAVWLLWPKHVGKPVAAPRTVSFEQSSEPPTTTGEQKLTLTPEQRRSVQLKIETVGEAPSTEAAGQMATGVVQANTYKETPIVSLVGGIVRSISAELGQNIRRGQRVVVVFSNELADAQSRYLTALAVLNEHHQHHMRTVKLVEIGAASKQELETATSQLRDAESNLANLRQKLMLLGLSAQRIDSLKDPSQISSELSVASPAAGTITARSVNPGEVIEANKELMRVTDLSTVWVIGQIYEKDLATIRVGSGANVTSDAYPGRVFRGRVTYVDPKIDPATRTAQVRIEMANPRQMFKIGMFVNVAFGALGVEEKTMALVPKTAVQTIANQQFVFVATESPNEFLVRPVRVGTEANGFYSVVEGLNVGERVVTEGSFLLRAEWLKMRG